MKNSVQREGAVLATTVITEHSSPMLLQVICVTHNLMSDHLTTFGWSELSFIFHVY